jgi:hypothetical protein
VGRRVRLRGRKGGSRKAEHDMHMRWFGEFKRLQHAFPGISRRECARRIAKDFEVSFWTVPRRIGDMDKN